MAEEGDREMVLANFQVNLSSCYFLCLVLRIIILLLISNQSITGIENLDECITLLDHHNWDLMVRSDFSLSFSDFCRIPVFGHIYFNLCFHCFQFPFLGLCELSTGRRDGFSSTVCKCCMNVEDWKWMFLESNKSFVTGSLDFNTCILMFCYNHRHSDYQITAKLFRAAIQLIKLGIIRLNN